MLNSHRSDMNVPTLMYHSIDRKSADYLTVEKQAFCKHIAHLRRHYVPVGIQKIIGFLKTGCPIPDNAIVISFDDSLRKVIDHAVPVLKDFDAPAIFFIITGYLGDSNLWDHRAYSIEAHMTENDICTLFSCGFEIGSHTVTHQRLPKLPRRDKIRELRDSQKTLARITGVNPVSISYPYGDADRSCVELCRTYYQFGFASIRQGYCQWSENPLNIRRIYVSPDDSVENLDRKIAGYRKGISCPQ